MKKLTSSGSIAFIDTRILIDLEDDATQKQIEALKDFFRTTLFEDEMTNFLRFIFDTICKYNDLRKELKIASDKQPDDKIAGAQETNLDTDQLDATIRKTDELIQKLQTASSLIDRLNKDKT